MSHFHLFFLLSKGAEPLVGGESGEDDDQIVLITGDREGIAMAEKEIGVIVAQRVRPSFYLRAFFLLFV